MSMHIVIIIIIMQGINTTLFHPGAEPLNLTATGFLVIGIDPDTGLPPQGESKQRSNLTTKPGSWALKLVSMTPFQACLRVLGMPCLCRDCVMFVPRKPPDVVTMLTCMLGYQCILSPCVNLVIFTRHSAPDPSSGQPTLHLHAPSQRQVVSDHTI
eukprot:1137524-Pelagomonas_calceolata.AAC.3